MDNNTKKLLRKMWILFTPSRRAIEYKSSVKNESSWMITLPPNVFTYAHEEHIHNNIDAGHTFSGRRKELFIVYIYASFFLFVEKLCINCYNETYVYEMTYFLSIHINIVEILLMILKNNQHRDVYISCIL